MSLELPLPNIHDGGKPCYPRIVLFQNGLGVNLSNGFAQTIKNIINYSKKDASPLIIDNTSEYLTNSINMSAFNPENGAFATTGDQNLFNSKISRIYELANNNLGKAILVETYLANIFGTSIGYDSIENQKIRLIKIIDALHAKGNVEIFLVGHSQGGLVNLEAAIDRGSKITRMISICTPYAPVDFARVYYFLLMVLSPVLSADKDREYKKRVEALASEEYYTQLKRKWASLSPKPALTVITGAAGTFSSTTDSDKCEENAFDILVKVDEQKNIDYASFINLIDKGSPCYDIWKNSSLGCVNSTTCSGKCNSSCKLEKVGVVETFIDLIKSVVEASKAYKSLVDDISDEKDENEINATIHNYLYDNFPIYKAIYLGMANGDISDCPSGYEQYYRIAACQYNHDHIRYNDETTKALFNQLTVY